MGGNVATRQRASFEENKHTDTLHGDLYLHKSSIFDVYV